MSLTEVSQAVLWLSISINMLFLLYLPIKMRELWTQPHTSTRSNLLQYFKIIIGLIIAVALIVSLACLSQPAPIKGPYLGSIFLSALAAICLNLLFYLEQGISLTTSSDLATVYLIGSIVCDMVILTIPHTEPTLWNVSLLPVLSRCVAHTLLLILECCNGGISSVEAVANHISTEEVEGIFSRILFLWINPILVQGYRHILKKDRLPYLSQDIKPGRIRRDMLEAWYQRAKPETKMALPLALFRCLKKPFLAAIIPRLFLIVFRYSQPILIRCSIHYVSSSAYGDWESTGYIIVMASIIVNVGLVVSTTTYQHHINRLKLSTKSALIGVVYDKMMTLPTTMNEDGEAITLMNTDAEGLEGIAEMFHEIWAQVLEVVIGMTLLARQVGSLWLLLVFLIFLCSRMSSYIAQNLKSSQRDWNIATQTRIAATTTMLNSMKVVKMLGIQKSLAERIQWLRVRELFVASRVRWMMVYANAVANALGIFSPAIIIALFATWLKYIKGVNIDAETGFTTLAVLGRVTHPANMIMSIIPRAVVAFAGFERIQEYLMTPALDDRRSVIILTTPQPHYHSVPEAAIRTKNLTTGYMHMQRATLDDISIDVAPASFVIVSGPVSCGKSTLLRAILGEVPASKGSIAVSTKQIAYCAQKSWLPGGSIREIITGFLDQYDLRWYREVVDACCLMHDLDALPEVDETQAGSRGHNLSGGQRQRVALARAIFARDEIVLLDDSFSALDGETENRVFDNLLGPSGLLKRLRATIVLVSNNSQHYHSADNVIILDDNGCIKEQGPWHMIRANKTVVTKFRITTTSNSMDIAPVVTKNLDQLGNKLRAVDEAGSDIPRQTGDSALYHYFFSFAGFRNLAQVSGCTASYALFVTLPQYWLKLWTESDSDSTAYYIAGLLAIAFVAWASTSGTLWGTLVRLAPQAGLTMHRHLLGIVTRAPLIFFSMTDIGSVLNRFSQDAQLIDKQLPMAVADISNQTFKLLVQAVLLFLAQKWLLLSLPAVLAVVYIVQKVYLRTSRQLRFIELESRAAIFSSFLESIEGLETIRAFSWYHYAIHFNDRSVENAQRPEFLLLALQRWLNLVLDLMAATLSIIIIGMVVAWREDVSVGQVGISLNVVLATNVTLLRLVESWTTLEVSLGAAARLKLFEEHTPSETETVPWSVAGVPLQNWKIEGKIEMKDVTASYQSETLGIRRVTLVIEAGQKVLICGRTGSGKSSLILTLLRMIHLQSGLIELDSIDISQIPPTEIRQRYFVTVSQDLLILPQEDLRFNLEPEESVSDAMLIQALTIVGLWSTFQCNNTGQEALEPNDNAFILDKKLSQFPPLSAGQCQLFALARAIVKVNSLRAVGARPIVVLDEITSSVDAETEGKIHGIIDREFSSYSHTVIIITHRMDALADYVRVGRDVLVRMADGEVKEVVKDITPAMLRWNEGSDS